MADVIELGKRVKAKYPEYAGMSDVEVGRKVKAKYPEYSDFADVPDKPQEQPGFLERAYDASIGGILDLGKQVLQKGAPRVADEIGTAVSRRFQQNPMGFRKLEGRLADAVFGPVMEQFAGDVQSGNYGGAAGTVAGNLLMALGPKAIKTAAKPSAAPAAARPAISAAQATPQTALPAQAQQSTTLSQMLQTPKPAATPMSKAVQYAKSKGIPVTVGEEAGSPMLQRVERAAENVPGSSSIATDFYNARNQAVADQGKRLVRQAGKVAEDETAAAQAVIDRVQGRATDLKDWYARKYDSVEKAIERNQAKLQAQQDAAYQAKVRQIEKANRAELAYVNTRRQLGSDAGIDISVFKPRLQEVPPPPEPVIAAEVNLRPVKGRLKGLYDELTETMPETQRAASPGYQRLKNIVEGPDNKPAMALERDLGELKRVLRVESEGYETTKSGRYAAAVIRELEKGVQASIERAGGPKAVEDLLKARKGVAEMHRTFDALEDLLPQGDSPANLFMRATAMEDRALNKIIEIKKRAPQAVKEIGATYLDGALQKMAGEAGTADMTASVNQWKRLGKRTKIELYGPKLTEELDSFFQAAPNLVRNINKSGTANASAAGKLLGSGSLLLGAFVGGPEGLMLGAGSAVAGAGSARAIANWLFTPGNARKLKQAAQFGANAKSGKFYMQQLNRAVEADPDLLAALQSARTATQARQASQGPEGQGPTQ